MQSWGSWGEVYLLRKWSPKKKVISNCQPCIRLKKCMLKIKGWLFIQLIWILKGSKGIWILKSCYNMCEKEMDLDAKSILARAKDGWPLKKLTWESCWGKRPLLTFSWCHQEIDGRKSPKHSWKWNLNPKTETFLFLFQLSQIISHENRNIYLLTFFLCWLFIQAWKEQDEDERLDISVCTVLQQRLWWALIWQNV